MGDSPRPLRISLRRSTVLTKPVDELRTEDVDLSVQDAPPVGDFLLLGGQLVDQLLELRVVHRTDIGKGFLLHWIS